MPKVKLREFNRDKRTFDYLKEVELASVPTSGDKIIVNIRGTSFIFRVYDVLYSDYNEVDVNVIRMGNISEYNLTGFPDIIE